MNLLSGWDLARMYANASIRSPQFGQIREVADRVTGLDGERVEYVAG